MFYPTFPSIDQSALQLHQQLATCQAKDVQMASIATIQSCKLLVPKEDSIIDLYIEVHEPIPTLGNLTEIKNKLTQIPNFIPNNFCSSPF